MIGICGFLQLDGQAACARALVGMQRGLPRSGTADFTSECQGPIAMGAVGWHANKLVDVSPALYRHVGSGCVVVADTRLQHREALARSLDLPADGRPFTDAQLIAHTWLRHGEDCTARLAGDFAFAVWDPRKLSLFCARDVMGVRPLYLHHAPGHVFAFASQAGALLQLPGVSRDLDEGRIADALTSQLEAVDKTSTFYKAIKRLPPAQWASARPGHFRQQQYWELTQQETDALPRGDAEWDEALGATLERVVARHLDGDAAVGCMLSGGMDSSSLAVIARDQVAASGRGPLATFSSIDDDPACAETRAIRAVLEQPGFAPTLIGSNTINQLRHALESAGQNSDEPFDASMYLLHAQYLMAARQGIDAVMDGGDADVLLTDPGAIIHQIRGMQLGAAWRNARGLHRMYPALPAWKTMAVSARAAVAPQRLRVALWATRQRQAYDATLRDSLMSPAFARAAGVHERVGTHAAWSPPVAVGDAWTRRVRSLSHPNTTVGFERYHRVAAHHGIEPRHPFNDRELLELCVHLPVQQRLSNGWTKIVLRRAMQGRLPDAVCWRTGKEHLGPGLIRKLVFEDHARVRERLAAVGPVLAPYVDSQRLVSAAARLHDPKDWLAHSQVLKALNLGEWLAARGSPTPSEPTVTHPN